MVNINTNTRFPRAVSDDPNDNLRHSLVEDGSFMRIKVIQLGIISRRLLQKLVQKEFAYMAVFKIHLLLQAIQELIRIWK